MATLVEVQDDIALLQSTADEISARLTQIEAIVESLRAGGVVTAEDLDGLRVAIAGVQTVLVDVREREDVIIAG